ncbi:TonB C-terminal domain-containing protein [Acidicapsa ligni]|uniref:TonB C-terminal domain-containing protein n=1 Tax=Acidicapsa ligni TaxID=542300 RepID=UPI0021E0697B|nr:TonB C-terminal domain-containing protein [Acidicapsa ligni]
MLFHGLLVGLVLGYGFLNGLFPHNTWGGATEGAIAVQLVSSALPLPADHKPNDNVLATEKPSEAPAPPAPKAQPTVDEKAIPIPSKIEAPKKPAAKKQEASKIPEPKPVVTSKTPQRQPTPPKQDNRAQYGEQSSSAMQRTAQPGTTTVGATSVTASPGSRGFNYPWYIQNIQRKMQQNLYRGEVDPRTPVGSRTYITWVIRRDGTGMEAKLDKSSGSPTLDRACLRAEQRVDTFGPLPSPPSDPPPNVSYYCEY